MTMRLLALCGLLLSGSLRLLGQCTASSSFYQSGGLMTTVLSGTPTVTSAVVFDDGSGPRLYVAGVRIVTRLGQTTMGIARQDSGSWAEIPGIPIASPFGIEINSLCVHDDGSGAALYAGGTFTTIGGIPAQNLARWNGTSWTAINYPYTIRSLESGVGPVGAALHIADVVPSPTQFGAARVTVWNQGQFSLLGTFSGSVDDLECYDSGAGSELYACGRFNLADTTPINGVARYRNQGWTSIGSFPQFSEGWTMAVHDDGTGARLMIAGGTYGLGLSQEWIVAWNGLQATNILSTPVGLVRSMISFDDGTGTKLWVGGQFRLATGLPRVEIATYDGSGWSAPGGGLGMANMFNPFGSGVHALAATTTGMPTLYAAGQFTSSLAQFRGVAAWSAGQWSITEFNRTVYGDGIEAMMAHDDGSGATLWLGGAFQFAGGYPASAVARFDGGTFVPAGTGMTSTNAIYYPTVRCFAVFDDGTGPAVYAAGSFDGAGGAPCNNIAKWNGTTWQPLGLGLSGGIVFCLEVWDDGTGPALYVGGEFTSAGGLPCNRIAKWNGAVWTPLGTGIQDNPVNPAGYARVDDLQGCVDAAGPALYVAGTFGRAGGVPTTGLARYSNAFSWTPGPTFTTIGGASASVMALSLHAEPNTAPRLWVGGYFDRVNGQASSQSLARLDLATTPMTASFLPVPSAPWSNVRRFLPIVDSTGPRMLVAGYSSSGGSSPTLSGYSQAGWAPVATGMLTYPTGMVVFDRGLGPSLILGSSAIGLPWAPKLAEFSCGVQRPAVQLFANAAGAWILDRGLTPGRIYHHLISTDPCPILGGGPFLGLCSSNWGAIIDQYFLPLGYAPFHFRALDAAPHFGPYSGLTNLTLDVLLIEEVPPALTGVAAVQRVVLP